MECVRDDRYAHIDNFHPRLSCKRGLGLLVLRHTRATHFFACVQAPLRAIYLQPSAKPNERTNSVSRKLAFGLLYKYYENSTLEAHVPDNSHIRNCDFRLCATTFSYRLGPIIVIQFTK